MDVPEIFRTKIARVLGIKSKNISIRLREPLDFRSNHLYDIWADKSHFIAKEFLKPDELEDAPLREYQALRLLSPLDIAPQPIYYEPATGALVIYEYMEGEMWDRQPPTTAGLSKLAELWIQVNALPVNWLSRGYDRSLKVIELEFHQHLKAYADWATSEFKPGERAAEMCRQLLENRHEVVQELSEQVPVLCFCRADPRFANVIQRPNGALGLVDWEDSGLRDPARDLADMITHPNQEDLMDWDAWQVFLEPYLVARSTLDRDIKRRMQLYQAIFPFFWLTIISRFGIKVASAGQLDSWTVNGISGNERLCRYLARAMAWPEMDFGEILDRVNAIEFFPKK